jgi:hypothetical protein
MGWTHEQFLAQPIEVINAIRIKMSVFARVANEEKKP